MVIGHFLNWNKTKYAKDYIRKCHVAWLWINISFHYSDIGKLYKQSSGDEWQYERCPKVK